MQRFIAARLRPLSPIWFGFIGGNLLKNE